MPDDALPAPSPEMADVIRDLLHVRCGRRLAEHPGGAVALCAFSPVVPAGSWQDRALAEFERIGRSLIAPAAAHDHRRTAERSLIRAARLVLFAHGHGIAATCTPACWDDADRPVCSAILDDDLDPLACHLPAGHHSTDHYDRDRRCTWTAAGDRAVPDPIPLPNDGPWPGGPGA